MSAHRSRAVIVEIEPSHEGYQKHQQRDFSSILRHEVTGDFLGLNSREQRAHKYGSPALSGADGIKVLKDS